ncbi:hypothetical protein RAA17_11930 [Komagataeibacter rhaeticus]|nr:hypothetical protein [Komagataeibacter rhaeticus]
MKRFSWRRLPSVAMMMVACLSSGALAAQDPAGSADGASQDVQTGSDIPAHVTFPTAARNYIKRDVMIPDA